MLGPSHAPLRPCLTSGAQREPGKAEETLLDGVRQFKEGQTLLKLRLLGKIKTGWGAG